jgi:hypothetical protein
MTMGERAEIEAAMDRLLDGIPLRSDGKLTVVSLAAEAGVKRHALTHKHTDLKDRFYARIKAQHSVPASETKLRDQIADLRRKLYDIRAERDEYKQAADALARALNVLTVENDELHRKANRTGQLSGPRPLSPLPWIERSMRSRRRRPLSRPVVSGVNRKRAALLRETSAFEGTLYLKADFTWVRSLTIPWRHDGCRSCPGYRGTTGYRGMDG